MGRDGWAVGSPRWGRERRPGWAIEPDAESNVLLTLRLANDGDHPIRFTSGQPRAAMLDHDGKVGAAVCHRHAELPSPPLPISIAA